MLNTRENIRIIIIDTIIILTIVFFGLLIYGNSSRDKTGLNRNPVSTFISVSENTAVTSPCLQMQVYQKTWISNRDNFDILAFNRNPLLENKITSLKILHLLIIRQNSQKIPQFLPRYHLFPSESGEAPYLS